MRREHKTVDGPPGQAPPSSGDGEPTADLLQAVAVAGGDPASAALETVVRNLLKHPNNRRGDHGPHAARFEPDRCEPRPLDVRCSVAIPRGHWLRRGRRLPRARTPQRGARVRGARGAARGARALPARVTQQQRAPTSSRRCGRTPTTRSTPRATRPTARATRATRATRAHASHASGELAEVSVGTEESAEGLLVDPTATEGLLSRPGTAMARGGLRDEVDSAAALIRPSTAMMLWEVHDAAPAGHVNGGAPDVLVIDHDAPSDDSDDDALDTASDALEDSDVLLAGARAVPPYSTAPASAGAAGRTRRRARRAW